MTIQGVPEGHGRAIVQLGLPLYARVQEDYLMYHQNVCIAVVDNHQQVKSILDRLLESGFNATQTSVIGNDHPDNQRVHGYMSTGEQIKFWGCQGAFWGGTMGMLAGVGFLFLPGIGPLIVGGPLLSLIVGSVEGAVGLAGIEALFAGLLHLGFSKDGLAEFEKELKAGKSLVIVHVDADEVIEAKQVLHDGGIAIVTAHVEHQS